jgi:hypothetical protein
MTLREIIAAHPDRFYRQTWFHGESFLGREASPVRDDFFITPIRKDDAGVYAADLAALYVTCPDDLRWRRFLWTDDYDKHGLRVYVAGVGQFGCDGFQIHRHLKVDHRWGWVA